MQVIDRGVFIKKSVFLQLVTGQPLGPRPVECPGSVGNGVILRTFREIDVGGSGSFPMAGQPARLKYSERIVIMVAAGEMKRYIPCSKLRS